MYKISQKRYNGDTERAKDQYRKLCKCCHSYRIIGEVEGMSKDSAVAPGKGRVGQFVAEVEKVFSDHRRRTPCEGVCGDL